MEDVSETEWDVVISGTGLQQSLLALALSRSNKKVLHVDPCDYYGGSEAAFSLQEIEEWVSKIENAALPGPFSNASLWVARTEDGSVSDSERLSFPRAYTLALAPQIIYSRSKLLSQLISSKIYRQLEFQAVGNWWIHGTETSSTSDIPTDASAAVTLRRIPNGREDIFSDNGIDVRAKRNLMKFLKFVVDYQNQTEIWQPHSESSLPEFLSVHFNIPHSLHNIILALTLSLDLPAKITVRYSFPRIARHLTSIGVFGPGFGAVLPKWGGASEIAQVACRAGAVGGAIYMLGTEVADVTHTGHSHIDLKFTNDEAIRTLARNGVIRTKILVTEAESIPDADLSNLHSVSKMIAIVSTDLAPLFATTVEGSPTAAVSVITFPSDSMFLDGQAQPYPIYIMAHSSDTGECPVGQCVIYASTSTTSNARARLGSAISRLLVSIRTLDGTVENTVTASAQSQPKILYKVYYEQKAISLSNTQLGGVYSLASSSLDLAFNDTTLDYVEDAWKTVMSIKASDDISQGDMLASYMVFEDRGGEEEDDE